MEKRSYEQREIKIIIEPIADSKKILALAGKFSVKHPIPAEKIRDYIEYAEKGRY